MKKKWDQSIIFIFQVWVAKIPSLCLPYMAHYTQGLLHQVFKIHAPEFIKTTTGRPAFWSLWGMSETIWHINSCSYRLVVHELLISTWLYMCTTLHWILYHWCVALCKIRKLRYSWVDNVRLAYFKYSVYLRKCLF